VKFQQIAGLPGAQADLFIIQNEQAFSADLTGKMDIRKLWEAASGNIFATPPPAAATPAPPAAAPATSAVNSADLEATIIELANQFLGKLGKTLAEKELLNIGGINALKDGGKLNEFLAALEKGSKLASQFKQNQRDECRHLKRSSKTLIFAHPRGGVVWT